MCGIAGILSKEQHKYCSNHIRGMIDIISHRGPDDEGVYCDENVLLGHKRLAILDIKSGHQPMFSSDKRHVIVYNGEIYNYLDLRRHLEAKGHVFKTHSDTEVLLSWIIKYGIEGLSALNGMFAFALWDSQKGRLLLARDRLGIKPLYYVEQDGDVFFSSEIKAILPFISNKEANLKTIYEFVTFQNILSEHTFFKDVQKLLPGTWISWDRSERKVGLYWDISFERNYNVSFEDCVEEYKSVLEESVNRHLIADVPVGTHLSGGIDSSTIAIITAKCLGQHANTFTGAFTDADYYDERIGSRAVASKIKAVAHEVEITAKDYLDNIGRVIYHLDEPTLGTGALPQYMVAKLVSQSVKVVLSGHGGDEMFAGYQVNKVALLKEVWNKNPWKTVHTLFGIRMDEWTRVLYFLVYPFFCPEVRHGLYIMTPKGRRSSFLTEDFLAQNEGFDPFEILSGYVEGKNLLPGEKLMTLYLKTYLPTLFNQEDKVSMAHSVETRTPLCDNHMITLACKYPLHIKLWKNSLKSITKEAMRGQLPDVIYRLPKRGFPTPFAKWFREEPVQSFMQDLLFDNKTRQRGIIDVSYFKKIFNKNQRSKVDSLYDYERANLLYSASVIELWFRTFIDNPHPQPVC